MAGSLRAFVYVTDGGIPLGINCDESNVEAVNGAAALVLPAPGAALIGSVDNLRYALYRNALTGATRKVVILTTAALINVPLTLNFYISTGGTTGAGQPFGLAGTRGERIRRYVGGDTGLTDGDVP